MASIPWMLVAHNSFSNHVVNADFGQPGFQGSAQIVRGELLFESDFWPMAQNCLRKGV
jgi:hypothetical protein